jgi:mutator protein MutT
MNTQYIIASALIHKNGKILIAKRAANKKIFPDQWEVPGGHVEFGESAQEAVAREVREEIHVDIIVGEPVFCFSYISSQGNHAIEVDFLATLKDESQSIKINPEDHSEYKWVDEVDCGTLFEPHDWNGQAVKKAFEVLKQQK